MKAVFRILGYLIGAVCLLQLAVGAVGLLGLIFRMRAMGASEVLLSLCLGIVSGGLAVALFRLSEPKAETGTQSA
jgi:hypothetical protein